VVKMKRDYNGGGKHETRSPGSNPEWREKTFLVFLRGRWPRMGESTILERLWGITLSGRQVEGKGDPLASITKVNEIKTTTNRGKEFDDIWGGKLFSRESN